MAQGPRPAPCKSSWGHVHLLFHAHGPFQKPTLPSTQGPESCLLASKGKRKADPEPALPPRACPQPWPQGPPGTITGLSEEIPAAEGSPTRAPAPSARQPLSWHLSCTLKRLYRHPPKAPLTPGGPGLGHPSFTPPLTSKSAMAPT